MLRFFICFLSLFFSVEVKANGYQLSVEEAVQEVGTCDKLLSEYPVVMIPVLKGAVRQTLYTYILSAAIDESRGLSDTLAYFSEKYIEQLNGSIDSSQFYPNSEMADAVKRLSGENKKVVKDFSGVDGFLSDAAYIKLLSFVDPDKDQRAWAYWVCELVSAYSGIGEFSGIHKEVLDFVDERPVEGKSGDFYVRVLSCSSRDSLGMKRRVYEPELWEGAKFYIVNVSMENVALKSRQPSTGRLIIINDGVEYTYDSPERVLLDGYNFNYSRVGPLLKVESKIAFIVPKNLKGEVFWSPAGSGDRFWCGWVR